MRNPPKVRKTQQTVFQSVSVFIRYDDIGLLPKQLLKDLNELFGVQGF
jgi:hypothetical protein